MMKKTFPFIALALICSAAFALPVHASEPITSQNYRRALNAIESGRPDLAYNLAEHGHDPVLDLVIQGYAMALPGNGYSFEQMSNFITQHPDWPGLKGVLMIAEQKMPSNFAPTTAINWFNAHPPVTMIGFYRFIEALDYSGQMSKAAELVRQKRIDRDFASADELAVFYSRFNHILTTKDHAARLDRLLWDNNITAAKQMYRFVDEGAKSVAEARLALANQLSAAETFVGRVPAGLQNDPGLLYERLRWRRKNNLDESADEILLNAPAQLGRPDMWWDERNIMIRRAIERRDYRLAYRFAAEHKLSPGQDYAQAEFLAGWLALRFLNHPDQALTHFDNLYQNANAPISRARGAYWMGRAYEALSDKNEAEQSYETAAALNTTFYGLMAATRLYAEPTITASPEPAIPAKVRENFFSRSAIQATAKLYQLGYPDRAHTFFKAATDYASQRVEFVLLTELAYQLKRPDWAINAAKAANQKNMIMATSAYPILNIHIPSPPDPAFTHALIRQESLFNADAGSSAGARGLMQLMPRTAQGLARKLGMRYAPQRLTEIDYNLRLGTTFIQDLLDQYGGSYVLALAAYNAGPGRVREWLAEYGDPRGGRIDPLDWIELIPIYETRNYVERIIENFEIYRARLNGGKASLTILQDLRK